MTKRKLPKIPKRVAIILPIGLLFAAAATSFVVFFPLETVHVGECGGARPTRLSLMGGDLKKFEAAKKDAQEQKTRKTELLKQYPGIAMGCSLGPAYELYLF